MEKINKPQKQSLITFSFGLYQKEKEYIFENLSVMIDSGINLSETLEALILQVRSARSIKDLEDLIAQVDEGVPFWKAVETIDMLPKRLNVIIKIGEEAGLLSQNLKIIVLQKQRENDIRQRIKSALIYPLFIISIMLIVGSAILLFILPKLSTLYQGLNVDLPLISKIFIGFGNFMSNYGLILVPSVLITIYTLIYFLFINKKTNHIGQSIALKIPFVSKIIQEIEISKFGFILGTLLEGGIPIIFALESLASSSDIYKYKNIYGQIRDDINEGFTFQNAFEHIPNISAFLPRYVQHMVVTGEKSGNLALLLTKVGTIYEKRSEVSTKNITVLIEPILLIFVWVGVSALAFAVIVPIYSLVGNFNTLTGAVK